jgi:hypothetical protein
MAQPPKPLSGYASHGIAAWDAYQADCERAAHAQFKRDYAGHSRSVVSLFALASQLIPSLDDAIEPGEADHPIG